MDQNRVERVSTLVSRVSNPTEEEVNLLFGGEVSQFIFEEWQGHPDMVLFTARWIEFSNPGCSYVTIQPDTMPYTWEYQIEDGEGHEGFKLIESGVGDWLGCSPSIRTLLANFAPHVVDKILRPLDPNTGDPARGEIRCVGIRSIAWGSGGIDVWYATERPDGSEGTKKMHFYTHRHVMRCLALTEFKPGVQPSVILVNENRRSRGERLLMCPSGGEDLPTLLDVLAVELKDETGSELNSGCQVYDLGKHFTDDGVSSDPIHLLVVTGLQHVVGYTNPGEGISEVVAMPWTEFLDWVRTPDCRDMYAKIFATAVSLNVPKGEVFIQWPNQRIM